MNRRSVRFGFDGRPVAATRSNGSSPCGLAAPSSKNAQPWRFHVRDRSQATWIDLADAVAGTQGHRRRTCRTDPTTGDAAPAVPIDGPSSRRQVLREAPAAIWVENLGAFSAGRETLPRSHGGTGGLACGLRLRASSASVPQSRTCGSRPMHSGWPRVHGRCRDRREFVARQTGSTGRLGRSLGPGVQRLRAAPRRWTHRPSTTWRAWSGTPLRCPALR